MASSQQEEPPQSTPKRKRPTAFLDLPAELRNRIYFFALPKDRHIHIHSTRDAKKATIGGLPGVRGQVGLEASDVFFGNNTFKIYPPSLAVNKFLKLLRHKRRHMIEQLEIVTYPAYTGSREEKVKAVLEDIRMVRTNSGGLRPEAIIINLGRNGTMVPLKEVPEFEVVGEGDAWSVKATLMAQDSYMGVLTRAC